MLAKLVNGTYQAVITDSQQLIPAANKDQTCSLNLLPGIIEPFDLAFAFSKNFPYPVLKAAVDEVLIDLQENGVMSVRPLLSRSPPLLSHCGPNALGTRAHVSPRLAHRPTQHAAPWQAHVPVPVSSHMSTSCVKQALTLCMSVSDHCCWATLLVPAVGAVAAAHASAVPGGLCRGKPAHVCRS